MLLLLLGLAALALGARVGRWAVLWVPVGLGALALAALVVAGGSWWPDTPLPFLVLVLTLAAAVGVGARRRGFGSA
jgi:hypothetical protein